MCLLQETYVPMCYIFKHSRNIGKTTLGTKKNKYHHEKCNNFKIITSIESKP